MDSKAILVKEVSRVNKVKLVQLVLMVREGQMVSKARKESRVLLAPKV
jgi:hypothetical protein